MIYYIFVYVTEQGFASAGSGPVLYTGQWFHGAALELPIPAPVCTLLLLRSGEPVSFCNRAGDVCCHEQHRGTSHSGTLGVILLRSRRGPYAPMHQRAYSDCVLLQLLASRNPWPACLYMCC